MIVRMAKIMIIGPLELLMPTLTLIQELGIMQVDPEISSGDDMAAPSVHPLPDKQTVLEHQLYEKLRKEIDELLGYYHQDSTAQLPQTRKIAVEYLLSFLPEHLGAVRDQRKKAEKLSRELQEYSDYKKFSDAFSGLETKPVPGDLRWIGLRFEETEESVALQSLLTTQFKGKAVFEVMEDEQEEGLFGLILVEKGTFHDVLKSIRGRKVTYMEPPETIKELAFVEQSKILNRWLEEGAGQLLEFKRRDSDFMQNWYGVYQQARSDIDDRLSLMDLTASMTRSRMCFFIQGWIAASDYQSLVKNVKEEFLGKVVVEESELAEKDFSRIPTALHNPVYFEPFELFTRLLPMPPYASFDMTPFIGIFFPIFFGMMLGDMGYGLIILGGSVFLVIRFEKNKYLRDAGKILFISSLYTVVFGILYGELFGNVGHVYLGLKPIFFARHASIIPMLFFAVAAGVIHVIVGLVLGIIVSLRHKMKKEAIFKLMNILIVLCICMLAVSHFTNSISQVQKPLLLVVGVAMPALILVRGILAPLELLKNIGNIISYARIMAVGLTSVLLAFVANYMAGRIGSVWAGISVAVVLHIFNMLLGIFAPTIHSLRLHYVEFLSKFMEPGGKEFKPLGRKL